MKFRKLMPIFGAAFSIAFVYAQTARPSPGATPPSDDQILQEVNNASEQVQNWVEITLADALMKQLNRKPPALLELSEKIDSENKEEDRWEKQAWIIPASEMLPGEVIIAHLGTWLAIKGTVATCRQRYPEGKFDHAQMALLAIRSTPHWTLDL